MTTYLLCMCQIVIVKSDTGMTVYMILPQKGKVSIAEEHNSKTCHITLIFVGNLSINCNHTSESLLILNQHTLLDIYNFAV